MSKYIIDVGDAYIRHGLERTLTIPVRINEHEDHWMDTRIPLTPYTESDIEKVREEAYEKGKMDAYVEDSKNITMLKKEAEEAYQRGVNDAKEGKATCQYCEYQYLDDTEEPCKKCCKAYMNKYKPKAKEQQFQVGDEVVSEDDIKATVIDMDNYLLHVLDENGVVQGWAREDVAKTDRHFPEIAAVLEKMRGETND